MTIGIVESRRSSRVTSRPSRPGRPRSRMTRSGRRWRMRREGAVAVGGGQHREPGVLEVVAREGDDLGFVVHDEDRLHASAIVDAEAPPDISSGGAWSGEGDPSDAGRRPGRGRAARTRLTDRGRAGASRRTCRVPGSPRATGRDLGRHPSRRGPSHPRPGPPRQKIARISPNTRNRKNRAKKKPKIPNPGCQPQP